MRFISIVTACVLLSGCASGNTGTNCRAVYKTSATSRVSTPSASTRGSTSYRAPSVQTYAARTPARQPAGQARNVAVSNQGNVGQSQSSVRTTYGTMATVPPPPPPPPLQGAVPVSAPRTVRASGPVRAAPYRAFVNRVPT